MPTYSYRCTECGNAFDIQQSFSDDSLTVCPVCGGKLRKIFSAVGVTFNGSGFYRTDSRAKPSDGSSSGSGSGSKSEGAGSTTPAKSDSKPSGSASSTSGSSGSGSSGSGSSTSGSSGSGSSGKSTPAS